MSKINYQAMDKDELRNIIEELEQKKKKTCCGKEMIKLGEFYNMNSEGDEWLCGECGSFIRHETIEYDDEELFDILKNLDSDEIRNTKIYKELKEELK
ncbi:MAG TPA: hypothetical protein VGB37_15520 [Candidatus Lokiarchaeia archaeon]